MTDQRYLTNPDRVKNLNSQNMDNRPRVSVRKSKEVQGDVILAFHFIFKSEKERPHKAIEDFKKKPKEIERFVKKVDYDANIRPQVHESLSGYAINIHFSEDSKDNCEELVKWIKDLKSKKIVSAEDADNVIKHIDYNLQQLNQKKYRLKDIL